MSLRKVVLTGAIAAAFLFAGAGTAEAHPDRNCSDRIRKEQSKLERDIRKHGWRSRQAEHRRDKIHQLQRQCGGGFFGFWGRDRDRDRRWDRDRDRNDRWRNDRRNDRDRRDWYWDGRQWRRR